MMNLLYGVALTLVLGATVAKADTLTKRAEARQDRTLGVGIVFEGETGLSLYSAADEGRFYQAGLAWGPRGSTIVTADYAFGYARAIESAPAITPYWGIGAIALQGEDRVWGPNRNEESSKTDLGVRLPLGLNGTIPKTPVQLGGELTPTLLVSPASYSYLQGGLYARVLF